MSRKAERQPRDDAAKPAAVAAPAAPQVAPGGAILRMYRQGLGDCLYGEIPRAQGDPFRFMIDCGLVLGAEDAKNKMTRVMEHVVASAPAGLDLLVVTHPHWDHVSGFVQADEAFKKLTARAVWVGWPENQADPDAKRLREKFASAEKAVRAGVRALRGSALGTDLAQADEAEALYDFLGAVEGDAGFAAAGGTTLDGVGAALDKAGPGRANLRYCDPTKDAPWPIPGTEARIYVLGPPRDDASLKQMDPHTANPETYSMVTLGGLEHVGAALNTLDSNLENDDGAPFKRNFAIPLDHVAGKLALTTSAPAASPAVQFLNRHYFAAEDWRRIDLDWTSELSPLALLLDRSVNNSSLVLAIELSPGGDVILLAADAQVGNWLSWLKLEWNVDGRRVTGPDLIARTVLYKVGHHASLNATLREKGVETMDRLRYAMVPVNAAEAKAKHWENNIPLASLLEALTKGGKSTVLRSDQPWAGDDPRIHADDLYYEVRLG